MCVSSSHTCGAATIEARYHLTIVTILLVQQILVTFISLNTEIYIYMSTFEVRWPIAYVCASHKRADATNACPSRFS